MAIFEVLTEKDKDLFQLYRKLNYITDCCATNRDLIYGSAVCDVAPYEEMINVKRVFNQTGRNAYMHYVLSLKEDEETSLFHFKTLAIEVCELLSTFCGNYQVLVAVHTDTDNLHAHYLSNNIDYLTGERLDLHWSRLEELKDQINIVLHRYHLSLAGREQSS